MNELKIKRVYDPYEAEDGCRILVDRLWPRGISREKGRIDLWAKQIAPSTEARIAFGHMPERMAEFKQVYLSELDRNPYGKEFIDLIIAQLSENGATLLYGARDTENNHAAILREWIVEKLTDLQTR